MTNPVRIRLEADDATMLDEHETALRQVLNIGATTRDYPNRRYPGICRYLESTGVQDDAGERPSPVMLAEDAKRRRDLGGEIGALMSADADLKRQPWLPLQPGDVVLTYIPGHGRVPAFGTTYVAVDGETDPDTGACIKQVSSDGSYDTGALFYELWFEYGADAITVIRAGAVVHGSPGRA